MWIVPKSLHSVCALDTAVLTSDSSEFCQRAEQSLMWRSKPSPAQTWLRRWKRVSWLRLLSGRTLNRLTEEPFEAEWTSSLGVSPVNRSLPLAIETPTTTPDTSSLMSYEQLGLFSQDGSFSKTSRDSSPPSSREAIGAMWQGPPYCSMSLEDWSDQVTGRRGESLARLKSERRTEETESSSWPTPTTAEGAKIGSQANYGQVGLSNHPAIVGQPDRAKTKKGGKNHAPAHTEKLNPDWVGQLMGLPSGWTDLGSWGTE